MTYSEKEALVWQAVSLKGGIHRHFANMQCHGEMVAMAERLVELIAYGAKGETRQPRIIDNQEGDK